VDFQMQFPPHLRPRHNCKSKNGHSSHPSIFIGLEGTQTGLHTDARASRFWMAVLRGRKKFRLFNQSDAEYLSPAEDTETVKETNTFHAFFHVDAFNANRSHHPKFQHALAWDATVSAGELIFIPETWPHQVRNEADSIAISYNFIDDYSLPMHKNWVRRQMDNGGINLGNLLSTTDESDESDDDSDDSDSDLSPKKAATMLAVMSMPKHIPVATLHDIDGAHQNEKWSRFFKRNHREHDVSYNKKAFQKDWEQWLEQDDLEEKAIGNQSTAEKVVTDNFNKSHEVAAREHLTDEHAHVAESVGAIAHGLFGDKEVGDTAATLAHHFLTYNKMPKSKPKSKSKSKPKAEPKAEHDSLVFEGEVPKPKTADDQEVPHVKEAKEKDKDDDTDEPDEQDGEDDDEHAEGEDTEGEGEDAEGEDEGGDGIGDLFSSLFSGEL